MYSSAKAVRELSDGKLTTGIKDFRIRKVLEEFHKHGAPKEILYYSKPHVGTDNLSKMVASIRSEIRKLGGEVRFSNKLVNVKPTTVKYAVRLLKVTAVNM